MADRVKEWTREWEQQGLEKGLKKGLKKGLQKGLQRGLQKGRQEEREKARTALIRELEKRFGPLPEETRGRVESIDSLERIVRLSARAATAPSLAALRLG